MLTLRKCLSTIVVGLLGLTVAKGKAEMPVVNVSIASDQPTIESQLELGMTHTLISTDHTSVDPGSGQRAIEYVKPRIAWQNTHIIGWGPNDINPSPGVYDFSTLDTRIEHMRQYESPMVITLCQAPGWMKRHGKTWEMEDRPNEEHFDDFAQLCLEVAKRYPDVRHYQVWNEFKGFWSKEKNAWDVELYTKMYNKVYDALKAYDPTLQVGGLYLVVSGTGSGKPGVDTGQPILAKERQLFEYWLEHKSGADFICVDKAVKDFHDKNDYTFDELVDYTRAFQDVGRQVREMTDLPIWWAEYYGVNAPGMGMTPEQTGVGMASVYYHMIHGGSNVALLWGLSSPPNPFGMVSDIRLVDGGHPLPHGEVFGMINEHFGKGTTIYPIESSDPKVEALVSDSHALLINKANRELRVAFEGKTTDIPAYGFVLNER